MNGNGSGIVPTVDLATNNNNGYGYPYPVMPFYAGNGYGNNGFFGGEGIWAIVLLALLFNNGWGGFGGFGGFGGGFGMTDGGLLGYAIGNNATKGDVSDGLANVQNSSKLDNISTQISNGFSNTAQDICNVRSDILTGNMGLSNAILDSKYANQIAECQTQRDILTQTNELNNNILAQTNELNTNLLTQALQNQAHVDQCCCDIKELIRADGDETRALITQNTIQDLRDRLTAAQDVISDQRTESNIINSLSPRPIPSYIVSSPYQSIFPYNYGFGWGNGFNYGNGFFGNTIY